MYELWKRCSENDSLSHDSEPLTRTDTSVVTRAHSIMCESAQLQWLTYNNDMIHTYVHVVNDYILYRYIRAVCSVQYMLTGTYTFNISYVIQT